MKYVFFSTLLIGLLFISCNDDDLDDITYPRLFEYSHYEITENKAYLVGTSNTLTEVSNPRAEALEEEIRSFYLDIPTYITDFELLDEEFVHITLQLDVGVVWDSVLRYRDNGDYVSIDGFEEGFGDYYFEYNKTDEEFYTKNQTYSGHPGPNVDTIISSEQYSGITMTGAYFPDLLSYGDSLLTRFPYAPGDTLILIASRRVYL